MYNINLLSGFFCVAGLVLLVVGFKLKGKMNRDVQRFKEWGTAQDNYKKEKNRLVWDARYNSGEIPHIDEQYQNSSKDVMKSSALVFLCIAGSVGLFFLCYLFSV